ncbi:response regulator [Nocardia takedensis]
MRLVLVDDAWLIREGLTRLLTADGHTVVGAAARVADAEAIIERTAPDLAVLDIRMPPTHTDEGLRLASALRDRHPGLPLLLLSQYAEPAYARRVLELARSHRCGYLLKEHVLDAAHLAETLRRLLDGGVVIDPAVVAVLTRAENTPTALTEREREVLALMAEGLTDRGIAGRLHITVHTVGTHVQRVLRKLDIPDTPADNRRVLAVLTYLDRFTAARRDRP